MKYHIIKIPYQIVCFGVECVFKKQKMCAIYIHNRIKNITLQRNI